MADTDVTAHSAGTLEALQNHAAYSRRLRPPDLEMAVGDENRVPLRAETGRLGRRESKLGLRSLFGRHKTINEGDGSASMRELPPRTGGIRASLAEISNWPYGFHAARSEVTLHMIHQPLRPLSTAVVAPPANQSLKPKKPVPARSKTPTPSSRPGRGSLATWDPPPLFQAYPQAIKHAQLPACTISAEALLRLHGSKGSISLRDGFTVPGLSEDPSMDRLSEKAKKKHRRNTSGSSFKLDWTTKIYVLVTSGYLLQYAGEGSFDRLPEKILQIGKDSAAFASDLIPGKHWVVQVSTAMDPDGSHTSDSRSLFSRLPFRGSERRHASTFLMVFESVEDMEGWITTLRREIEHLGGKKSLSETGKPKADDNILQLRAQPSQRTLVIRDPDRFSRLISPESLPWNQGPSSIAPEIQFEAPESDSMPEPSFDDVSTTNSLVSHDGRQLENLRDSGNRLSFISSGQRTIVTSEGSSPPCSPVRDSFASQAEETTYLESSHETRRRPNAAEILDRRQSMQTMNPLVDFQIVPNAPPRPLSTYSSSWQEGASPHLSGPQTIPNFSVPHSMGKRYSLVKTPPLDPAPFTSPPPPNGRASRGSRRAPPPSLGFSRPLSIVADQPSPSTTSPNVPRDIGNADNVLTSPDSEAPDTPSIFATWGRQTSQTSSHNDFELPSRNSSLAQIQVTLHTSPKRHSSLQTLRSSESSDTQSEIKKFVFPHPVPPNPRSSLGAMPDISEGYPRSKSSLDSYGRSRSRSPIARKTKQAMYKRSSMYSQSSEYMDHGAFTMPDLKVLSFGSSEMPTRQSSTSGTNRPRTPRQFASNQQLKVGPDLKALQSRRSMPQLAEGPPPAPPPTCALPPLPPKLTQGKTRSRGIRA